MLILTNALVSADNFYLSDVGRDGLGADKEMAVLKAKVVFHLFLSALMIKGIVPKRFNISRLSD